MFVFLRFCNYISIYKTIELDNTDANVVFLIVREIYLMEKEFIEKMKADLLEQRQTILESLAEQSDDMRGLIKTVETGDEADVASDVIDRTLLTALGTQDARTLQQIDNALDRIRQDKYGRCIKCGKDIPNERLEAIPWALMCIGCAEQEERRNR